MRAKLLVLLTAILVLNGCRPAKKVDFLVTAKSIYVLDKGFSKVEAMAIHEGKIVATGSREEILGTYSAVEAFSYPDHCIYPSFYDAHCHFLSFTEALLTVNLAGTKSFDEVLRKVESFYGLSPNGWVIGRGWDQTDWEDQSFPTKDKLDSLYPNHPVLLKRIDGHAAIANSKALELAGLNDSSEVEGGKLLKINGSLSGALIDMAVEEVRKVIPKIPTQERIAAVMDAQKRCFEAGLTSLGDAYMKLEDIQFLDSLQRTGDLKLRIYAMIAGDDEATIRHFESHGPYKTAFMNVRSTKIFYDGALGSRGALLTDDYTDATGERGLQLIQDAAFEALLKRCANMGFQANTHAIGDAANHNVLEAYKSVLQPNNDGRWRIEHAQVVNPEDLSLFGEFKIIPSVQPTHATSDMYWIKERLGNDRAKHAYAYKDLLRQNGLLALGSDFPVEGIEPIKGIYAAVARKDLEGYPEEGFNPENALSLAEALRGFTNWPAYAAFEENEKGSLEPGKWADFVVLSDDLMQIETDSIPEVKIFETFVSGKRVYRRPIAARP